MPSWDHEDLKGCESAKVDRDAPKQPNPHRPKGLTTAMLDAAAVIVCRGHHVMLIGHNEAHAKDLASKIGSTVEHTGIEQLRLKLMGRRDVVPMIDHFALDILLSRMAALEDENFQLKTRLTRIGAIANGQ